VAVARSEVWSRGGAGGEELAEKLLEILEQNAGVFHPLYAADLPIKDKIAAIARQVYGADGVAYTKEAERAIRRLQQHGLGATPVCMAKTQYSLSDDPNLLGRPTGFKITVRDVTPSAGAGFVVALTGEIMTMPGLPKHPAAEEIDIDADGKIKGLF
jgi:formate--tetrahydrofolate ligase